MSVEQPQWYCLRLAVTKWYASEASRFLFGLGIGGLEEREHTEGVELVAYSERQDFLEAAALELLRQSRGVPQLLSVEVCAVVDNTWATAWTDNLRAQPLGDSFVLVPVHDRDYRECGRTRIAYEPELAFGDGGHPTTQLAASAVEGLCRRQRIRSFLDVGAGNGVLSFIAHFCGAERVLGLEIDQRALLAARRNATLNSIDTERCRFSSEPLESIEGYFEAIVANIEIRPLLDLIPAIAAATEDGGQCLITGFLAEVAELVEARLKHVGFCVHERHTRGDWTLLRAGRPVLSAPDGR